MAAPCAEGTPHYRRGREMSEWLTRFKRHYKVQSNEECWPWQSCRSAAGYGRFALNGKQLIASRVAYEIACGPIPDGFCVLHNCDNPSCVNPRHLRLGSHLQNMADRNSRGRARGGSLSGERHPRAKLSDAQRAEVRRLSIGGRLLQKTIGLIFGISQSHVSTIKNTNV